MITNAESIQAYLSAEQCRKGGIICGWDGHGSHAAYHLLRALDNMPFQGFSLGEKVPE